MNLSIIKTLLTEKRLSMTALAEKSGMSRRGFYSAIENNTISAESLEKVAEFLDVPIWEFFEKSAPVINRNKISELENEIQLLQDHITAKMKLERLFATSLLNVSDEYNKFINTLTADQKKLIARNEAFIRFDRLLKEAINEITFTSDMKDIERKK